VTNADWIKLGTLIFALGVVYAGFQQMRKDLNGIGMGMRAEKAENHRRWLFEVADTVEEADSQEKRNRLAARIRHSAYRI
jgi:hypothetical protein